MTTTGQVDSPRRFLSVFRPARFTGFRSETSKSSDIFLFQIILHGIIPHDMSGGDERDRTADLCLAKAAL
ncbi:MAG: hypothetical protein K8S15_02180, partial [Candidatus Aegiribacteria sp.]|nr:hypothetical protein [Candidatus Aegiribacteria sp.]